MSFHADAPDQMFLKLTWRKGWTAWHFNLMCLLELGCVPCELKSHFCMSCDAGETGMCADHLLPMSLTNLG